MDNPELLRELQERIYVIFPFLLNFPFLFCSRHCGEMMSFRCSGGRQSLQEEKILSRKTIRLLSSPALLHFFRSPYLQTLQLLCKPIALKSAFSSYFPMSSLLHVTANSPPSNRNTSPPPAKASPARQTSPARKIAAARGRSFQRGSSQGTLRGIG